jgi:hypothetical protein
VHRLHELISRAEGLGEIDASDGSVRGR